VLHRQEEGRAQERLPQPLTAVQRQAHQLRTLQSRLLHQSFRRSAGHKCPPCERLAEQPQLDFDAGASQRGAGLRCTANRERQPPGAVSSAGRPCPNPRADGQQSRQGAAASSCQQ
jgi:hypothetical protein